MNVKIKTIGLATLLYAGFSALGFAEIEEKLQQQYADNLIKEENAGQIVSDDLETQTKNAIPLVMTKTVEDDASGYFDGTNVIFSIQDGARIPEGIDLNQRQINALNLDRMIKIELDIGNKKITIQVSPDDNNLYIKGIDLATNQVTSLDLQERTLMKNLFRHSVLPDEMSEDHKFYLSAALSLLAKRPENVPIFIWKNGNEVIGAVSNEKAVRVPRKQADLYNREAEEIIPLDSNVMSRRMPSFDKSVKGTRRLAQPQLLPGSGPGISLCSRIGQNREGSYTTSILDCNRWDFWNCPVVKTVKFTHLVGGPDCWGRCGEGCTGDIVFLIDIQTCTTQ